MKNKREKDYLVRRILDKIESSSGRLEGKRVGKPEPENPAGGF